MAKKQKSDGKLIFDFQRSHSRASQRGWEKRWDRGDKVGKKGRDYLEWKYEEWDIEFPVVEYDYEDET